MHRETDARSCRFIVEAIKKHMIDEDVRLAPALCSILVSGLAVHTNWSDGRAR